MNEKEFAATIAELIAIRERLIAAWRKVHPFRSNSETPARARALNQFINDLEHARRNYVLEGRTP